MNPFSVIAEAVLRIEHKLDVLLRGLGFGEGTHPQLYFNGQVCPVCKKQIDYVVDIVNQVVKRQCGCTTGKQPPVIPLIPLEPQQTGEKHGDTAGHDAAAGAADSRRPKDRPRGQGR